MQRTKRIKNANPERKRVRKKDALPAKQQTELQEFYQDSTKYEKSELLKIQTEIETRIINIKRDIFQIGKLLFRAKKILPHGTFQKWIEDTFQNELPYSTAHFYMRVFETFKDKQKSVQYIPTKYLLMMVSGDFPHDVKEMIAEDPKSWNKFKLAQVKECHDLFKQGTIGNSEFLKIAKDQIKLGIEMQKGRTECRVNTNMRRSLYFGAGDLLKKIQALRGIARDFSGIYPYDPNDPQHEETMQKIKTTIKELRKLKKELTNDDGGFFKNVSTPNGNKIINNI